MKQQLTPWYPAEIKPVREGVYEVEEEGRAYFAYWNGQRFGFRASLFAAAAYNFRNHFTAFDAYAKWRGLAEEPK